jgi:type I restriction enzyme S subunit
MLSKGDIVFARTGATTGKSFLIGPCPRAVFASYLIRLRPCPEVAPAFLALYFQTPEYWRLVSENVAGNAQPNCNASKLAALPVPLPPHSEQQRIVAKVEALLAHVNAARQRLAKVPAILKRFRQSVLAAACSGRLTADWGEEEEREEDQLPASWHEQPLRELLREPLRNGHSAKVSSDGKGVRTLTLSAVTYADFSKRNTKLTVADSARIRDLWLEAGDILIERSNTPELVGTAAMYRGSSKWAIFPDLLIRARINEQICNDYVELFLRSGRARAYFRQEAGKLHLGPKCLTNLGANIR